MQRRVKKARFDEAKESWGKKRSGIKKYDLPRTMKWILQTNTSINI